MNLQEIDKNLDLKNWKYYLNDLKITTWCYNEFNGTKIFYS